MNNLNDNFHNGIKNYLFSSNENQAKRFKEIFKDIDEDAAIHVKDKYENIVFPLFSGFIDTELQIACYTDHQIFERYHKFSIKNNASKTNGNIKRINCFIYWRLCYSYRSRNWKIWGTTKIQVEGKTKKQSN